jgi:transcriptional regulator with XRE-family HTH domain
MPRTAEALVKPELLRWARDESGLTVEDVARKARVKPERLESWEQGEARPTFAQLRKLARIYRRPLAAFYLPRPPAPLPALRDFRRPAARRHLSPELRLAHREAVQRRELALELLREIGEAPRPFTLPATTDSDPEQTGGRLRAELGVTREQQVRWPSSGYARRAWGEACEKAGVLADVCHFRERRCPRMPAEGRFWP